MFIQQSGPFRSLLNWCHWGTGLMTKPTQVCHWLWTLCHTIQHRAVLIIFLL